MAKTPAEVMRRLADLARKADPEKNSNEHERNSTAMAACKLLREHAETLAALVTTSGRQEWSSGRKRTETTAEPKEVAPPKPSGPSTVHPKAAAHREWVAFKKTHELHEWNVEDEDDDSCSACGEPFKLGDTLLGGKHGWTHKDCAGWWWTFEFPKTPAASPSTAPADGFAWGDDDEIPF